MKLSLSPVRMDDRLSLQQRGDILIINGESFDFSTIPDGATLPADAVNSAWLASDVERVDGVLTLTLILPHGANPPPETLFPVSILTVDGDISLPPYAANHDQTVEGADEY